MIHELSSKSIEAHKSEGGSSLLEYFHSSPLEIISVNGGIIATALKSNLNSLLDLELLCSSTEIELFPSFKVEIGTATLIFLSSSKRSLELGF